MAAAVYCTIMKPDSVPSSLPTGEARQAVAGRRVPSLLRRRSEIDASTGIAALT